MSKKNQNTKTDSEIPRKNRSGIVVFKKNEDLFTLFTRIDHEATRAPDSEYISDCKKKRADDGLSSSYSHTTTDDSSCCLGLGEDQDNGLQKKAAIKKRVLKRDRHGIQFLDGGGSLSKMFNDAASADEEERFSELLETVLKGKNRESMLREKSDRVLPEPVPLKKKLKRYPPPQEELDLHGYTAKEAETRTESYLRSRWRSGLFTVQIIVGRGLHSPYGAVLPDVIEDLLIRLKQEGVLLWFEWDKRTKTQSGAAIAYLKQLT